MLDWIWLSLPLLALLGFGYALRRANELFALKAQAGQLELLRGRLPPALLSEFADIARREQLHDAEIRVLNESGVPRLALDGAGTQAVKQALRNVLGRYSVAQIRIGRVRVP